MIRRKLRTAIAAGVAVAAGAGIAAAPAVAITGGAPDRAHNGVGMLLYYQGDSRFRCTGTLVSPTVVITAGHCTDGNRGKTLVFFDFKPSLRLPRADDHDPNTGNSNTGYPEIGYLHPGDALPAGIYDPDGGSVSRWTVVSGQSYTHPGYSHFTDLKNWNDVGVIVLDAPVNDRDTLNVAPTNMLNNYAQPTLNKTIFTSIGYGTHVQKPLSGPQKPEATSDPIEREYAEQQGQKMTAQVVQMNGNPNNTKGTGGTCFGDSGGPSLLKGVIVTVTSYALNGAENCRYLGGYQRVDIPVVKKWLAHFGI